MPRFLISYRREDSAAYAGRLFDRLSDYFGRDNIFIDIDTIKPGQDFVHTISSSVIECDAVIAVIGKRWLTEQDASGSRRLDRPDDLLKVEIATALNRGVTVIPVLVGGAQMPDPADLPPDLARLGRLQALEIDDTSFHHDVHRLIETLTGQPVDERRTHGKAPWLTRLQALVRRRWWMPAGLAAAVMLSYVVMTFGGRSDSENGGAQPPSAGTSPAPIGSTGTSSAAKSPGANVHRPSTARPAARDSSESWVIAAGPAPATRTLPGTGSIERPQPIDFGVTYKAALDEGEAAFLALPAAVSALFMVLDMRPADGTHTNLQGRLSILDADGAMVEPHAITFNEIDYGYRRTRAISFGRTPATVRLKLGNSERRNVYWLTVFNTAQTPFVPLFGQVTPRPLKLGDAATGNIEPGEDLFFAITLKKGTYKVTVDLTNTPRTHTNIQAYLAVMDVFGGHQDHIIGFNEIDYAFRQVGSLSVKSDGAAIIRLQNQHAPATYTMRLIADGESSR